MASKQADFREEITAKIITVLESGTAPMATAMERIRSLTERPDKDQYIGINTGHIVNSGNED